MRHSLIAFLLGTLLLMEVVVADQDAADLKLDFLKQLVRVGAYRNVLLAVDCGEQRDVALMARALLQDVYVAQICTDEDDEDDDLPPGSRQEGGHLVFSVDDDTSTSFLVKLQDRLKTEQKDRTDYYFPWMSNDDTVDRVPLRLDSRLFPYKVSNNGSIDIYEAYGLKNVKRTVRPFGSYEGGEKLVLSDMHIWKRRQNLQGTVLRAVKRVSFYKTKMRQPGSALYKEIEMVSWLQVRKE